MYRQYLNDYEKRAEQIRKAARAVEGGTPAPIAHGVRERGCDTVPATRQKSKGLLNGAIQLSTDDILLLGLLFLLVTNEEKDMTLIAILGYLFLTGL